VKINPGTAPAYEKKFILGAILDLLQRVPEFGQDSRNV